MKSEKKENFLQKEFSISAVALLLFRNKEFITFFTAIFAISSVFFALSLSPIFGSTIVLKSVQENEPSLSTGLGMLGGIANISGSLGLNPHEEAILAMKHAVSKDFFKTLYEDDEFKKNLMAYKSFSANERLNTYDEAIFNTETNGWKVEPIFLNAHKRFTTQHMTIIKEKVGGFVNISIEHKSPIIAREWANLMYKELNKYMKKVYLTKINQEVEYLNNELYNTSSVELRKVISSLLENKIQKQMYANVSDDYIFEVVDSAYIPHERVRPSRAFICIMLTVFGAFFSCLIVFILDQFNKRIKLKPPFFENA
jgi:capsular polysaccharide biosynthesis protein